MRWVDWIARLVGGSDYKAIRAMRDHSERALDDNLTSADRLNKALLDLNASVARIARDDRPRQYRHHIAGRR